MKNNVPELNVFVSTIYLTSIIAALYAFKMSCRKYKTTASSTHSYQRQLARDLSLNFNKWLAFSWLKKYSIIGACLHQDKKYLLKQFLIMSTYAITCLKINKIILWPVSFITFLLPLSFLLLEIVTDKIATLLQQRQQTDIRNNNEIRSSELEINANNTQNQVLVAVCVVNNKEKQALVVKKERRLPEMVIMGVICFIAVVLYFQTVMVLTNSISNSGQLNISSVIIILIIDQFLVRSASGLTLFATLKLLLHYQFISLQSNILIQSLLKEQIINSLIQRQKNKNKKQEPTSSPFKIQNQANHHHLNHNTNDQHVVIEQINIINAIIPDDLFALQEDQPQQNVNNNTQQALKLYAIQQISDEIIFLTTPQRQLFAKEYQKSQYTPKQMTILNDITNLLDKQNTNAENLKKSEDISQEFSKDAITNNQDTIENKVLHIHDFSLENSLVRKRDSKKSNQRGARRKLQITGSSPYLEYLPNMLKNVEKYKQKAKDINQSKKIL